MSLDYEAILRAAIITRQVDFNVIGSLPLPFYYVNLTTALPSQLSTDLYNYANSEVTG